MTKTGIKVYQTRSWPNILLEKQKSDPDLTIGILTKALLAKLLDDKEILENSSDCLYDGVRGFHETAYEYCEKWLPEDGTLVVIYRSI